ncbi:MAG: hypothetical protein E7360_05875 [Clostridiales bacterium]|nr:hypothetical protein [Clostridiales bacterium]
MIYELNKIGQITEENQKRIERLEKLTIDEKQTVCEECNNLTGQSVEKVLNFRSKDGSGCVFTAKISSKNEVSLTCDLIVNGTTQKSVTGTLPFDITLPFLPQKGENQIVVWAVSDGAYIDLNLQVELTGNVDNGTIDRLISVISPNIVGYKSGNSFQLFDTVSKNTVYTFYGVETASALMTDSGEVVILQQPLSGKGEIFTVNLSDMTVSEPTYIPTNFTDCALKNTEEGVVAFVLSNGNVNSYLYKNTVTFIEKLPIKAKKIDCFKGDSGDYFYYTDMRDNVTVIKTSSAKKFSSLGSYSLGKKNNLILNEIDGSLKIFYQTGEIVVMRSIDDLSTVTPLEKGSQGVKCSSGKVFILDQKLIIL